MRKRLGLGVGLLLLALTATLGLPMVLDFVGQNSNDGEAGRAVRIRGDAHGNNIITGDENRIEG